MLLKRVGSCQLDRPWHRISFKTEWEVWNSERRTRFQGHCTEMKDVVELTIRWEVELVQKKTLAFIRDYKR